jgi:hypothetical protein
LSVLKVPPRPLFGPAATLISISVFATGTELAVTVAVNV